MSNNNKPLFKSRVRFNTLKVELDKVEFIDDENKLVLGSEEDDLNVNNIDTLIFVIDGNEYVFEKED